MYQPEYQPEYLSKHMYRVCLINSPAISLKTCANTSMTNPFHPDSSDPARPSGQPFQASTWHHWHTHLHLRQRSFLISSWNSRNHCTTRLPHQRHFHPESLHDDSRCPHRRECKCPPTALLPNTGGEKRDESMERTCAETTQSRKAVLCNCACA